jgi:hypothetical protein
MNNAKTAEKFEKNCAKLLQKWDSKRDHPFVSGVLKQLKEHNIDKRRIKTAHWCGKNGSLDKIIAQDSLGNPSDIVLEMKNGDFFGISVKQRKSSGCITYKNPGLGAIGTYLGYDYTFLHDEYEKIIVDHFGLPSCKKDRISILKNDKDLKAAVDMQGDIMLHLLLVHPEWGLRVRYEQMPHKSNVDHILSFWMNAKDPVIPYMIVVEKNGEYTFTDPMQSKRRQKLINSRKLYWGVNKTSLTVDLKTLNIMAMRIKYTSHKFASSIKFSGEYT